MKRIFYKIALLGFIAGSVFSCDGLLDEDGSDSDTVTGLKEALRVGIDTAANHLSQKDGYLADAAIKIALPDEAQTTFKAIEYLSSSTAGKAVLTATGSNIGESLEGTMDTLFNRAAEDAAPKSVNVFTTAISNMSISDGEDILFGSNNAATSYLKTNTYTGLQEAFHPAITSSLNTIKVAGYTSTTAWSTFATYNNKLASAISSASAALSLAKTLGALSSSQYATITSVQTVDSDLSNYVTGKALDGLFVKVADQELKIRTDVNSRVTDILKKVFGQLD